MILDGLDEALEEAAKPRRRRRRTEFGWRQVTVQVAYVVVWIVVVVLLLSPLH